MSAQDDLREQLAALAHEQWAGWMRYLFERCVPRSDGSVVVLARHAARWRHQMQTPYADLSEPEKHSDRAEADRVLALLDGLSDQTAEDVLRRMAKGWGQAATRLAAREEFLELERGSGNSLEGERAYRETLDSEREGLRRALRGLDAALVAELVTTFLEVAQDDEDV